jgi:hypothetical protein
MSPFLDGAATLWLASLESEQPARRLAATMAQDANFFINSI